MHKQLRLFVLIIFTILSFEAWAQVETSALFLTFKPGSRANAMGGAQTAIADDFYSAYYNPAGLVNAKRLMIGFNQIKWFGDLKHTYTGGVLQTPLGSVGFVFLTISTMVNMRCLIHNLI